VGARAISHLEEVSDDGIAAMAAAGVVAVLLPTTAYVLRLKLPPTRKMIDKGTLLHDYTLPFVISGVAVALGSDFNPNAFCMSMVRQPARLACIAQTIYLNTTVPEWNVCIL